MFCCQLSQVSTAWGNLLRWGVKLGRSKQIISITSKTSVGIASIFTGRDQYFSNGSSSLFSCHWLGLVSSKNGRVSANTAPFASCLATFAPPLLCCDAVMWLVSSSQRDMFCWQLMQSPIIVDRRQSTVLFHSPLQVKSIGIGMDDTGPVYTLYWYQILQYHAPLVRANVMRPQCLVVRMKSW